MANRFLETNYYKSPFVRGLKGAIKGLYSFIICDCTPSGMWAKDMEAASMYIGFNVTEDDFKKTFIETGKAIEVGAGRFFFPDFIEHQYPKGLQENNSAHVNIISELKKFNLLDESLKKVNEKGIVYWFVNNKKKDPLKTLDRGICYGYGYDNGVGEGFNTKPIFKNFNGLPEIKIGAVKELIHATQRIDATTDQVNSLWNVFKIQNLTGENYYKSEDKVYSHFINWVKSQKLDNGTGTTKNKLGNKSGGFAILTNALNKDQ